MADTIVALSTGPGRAAIAVIRVSGPDTRFVIETILDRPLAPRYATLASIRDGRVGDAPVLDRCLAVFFASPASATGEDTLELQIHGSVAVQRAVIALICGLGPGFRLAEPGEFTRRSLLNGKLDLLQVEALGDLLEARTPLQLQQAQRQLTGELGRRALDWRSRIIDLRAFAEASIDFADEGDVDADEVLLARVRDEALTLADELRAVLSQAARGQAVRDGIVVAITGPPNAGKSSLINALTGRQVALVSDSPGTTRDALEAYLDIGGWPVVLVDTAGLRETADSVEAAGVELARARARQADLVLVLAAPDVAVMPCLDIVSGRTVIRVAAKADLGPVHAAGWSDARISVRTGEGLDALSTLITTRLAETYRGEHALIARERQRHQLDSAIAALERASSAEMIEITAEELRAAAHELGRLSGLIDIEDVLDRLFAGFCIGK
jgi:tRNA modification GTPase